MMDARRKAVPKREAHPVGAARGSAKIWVVDDHPIVREGLVQTVQADASLTVERSLGSANETLAALREGQPDLVVVDLTLGDISGVKLIREIGSQWPQVPTLALSMHDERKYAERALRAGALGYIMKEKEPERLIEAVRTVLRGEVYLSEAVAGEILGRAVGGAPAGSAAPTDALTDRELEVYELIGRGVRTQEIATRLNIQVKTVDSHRDRIKAKLGLANAIELVQSATRWVTGE